MKIKEKLLKKVLKIENIPAIIEFLLLSANRCCHYIILKATFRLTQGKPMLVDEIV